MDPIPRYVNENENNPLCDYDLNRIQNLSLEGHNQNLNREADELKKQYEKSLGDDEKLQKAVLEAYRKGWSPTATCCCGGPMNHPDHSGDNFWTFPEPKLYSAAEDPTRKKYSPLEGPGPRKYTPLCNMQG